MSAFFQEHYPKQVTFNFPQASPYLLRPVAHDLEEALPLIKECVQEMEDRYGLMQQRFKSHVGELAGKGARPWRVVLFDELADLMPDRKALDEFANGVLADAAQLGEEGQALTAAGVPVEPCDQGFQPRPHSGCCRNADRGGEDGQNGVHDFHDEVLPDTRQDFRTAPGTW